jgi:hypothetical protein
MMPDEERLAMTISPKSSNKLAMRGYGDQKNAQ